MKINKQGWPICDYYKCLRCGKQYVRRAWMKKHSLKHGKYESTMEVNIGAPLNFHWTHKGDSS